MERFFDDTNDPAVGEPVLTPVAYQTRLGKASMAIRDYLHAPDILAVREMENLTVLQDLAARIGEDAIANGRSEEHTSELQSLMRISYAVFCLKKKKNIHTKHIYDTTNTSQH